MADTYMGDLSAVLPVDGSLLLIMKVVQILGGVGMVIATVMAVWSLLLQKREVMKQNKKIIELLEKISKK